MPKKVFELAKELDIGAIDVVEKLKASGMSVRNHMVKLSDEEVAQAMKILAPQEEETATKKKTKKKVTKKKVAKKKVTKKKVVRKSSKVEDAEEEEKLEPEVAAVAEKPESTETKVDEPQKEVAEIEAKVDDAPTPVVEEKKKGGLNIVATAEEVAAKEESGKKKTVVLVKKEDKEKKRAEAREKKELYKEKMHTFTPVFIPEKKPEAEKKEQKTTTSGSSSSPAKKTYSSEDKTKRKMSDLAAMMTRKSTGKAKDITQIRADDQMKFATKIVGAATYQPAKRKRIYSGPSNSTIITEVKDSKRVVNVHQSATADELARKLSVKFDNFKTKTMKLHNLLLKEEDHLGMKLCIMLAADYNYRVETKAFDEKDVLEGKTAADKKSDLPVRSPVVAVMGHVDHGKTTLLDHIRNAKVADGEAGGITQHIGAYMVPVGDSSLTFLDTPGHAAFANIRQRGADATDIVILVVAADDGVMPQTVESIRYCNNSNVPVIVAVNKMDKDGVNPDKIKQQLVEHGLTPEDWGGDTQFVHISALKGDGIDDLLESVKLLAEVLELRETPKGKAHGLVIESKIETGRGPVSTVLIQKGTLKKGDSLVVGETYGRARSLFDTTGKIIQSAGPSTPIQILGLDGAASPGDTLDVVKNEREAKKIVDNRVAQRKALENTNVVKEVDSLEDFFASASGTGEEKKILNLVVRADVLGSFEAIRNAVEALGNEEVQVKVIAGGAGAITDSDVNMATSASGYIMGFNMRPVTSARKLAEQNGVEIKTYSIIYELINDVTLALEGMLTPETIEKYIGRAEVKDTFKIPKIGTIAGGSVIDGKIERGCNIRLLREGKIIFDGKLSTLKRFKDEVKEVKNGLECGMALENFNDIQVADLIEAYTLEEKKRTLDSEVIL